MNLLTAEQVAQILNINPETVRLYARQGKLSCYRFGPRCVRFAAEDVEEFKERFRVEAVDVFVPKASTLLRTLKEMQA
ncbi:MAG: helix-turn-helix domain-containing protein [Actinomycetota bacterium]|jgi:excisionase family DNA binding protein|nr:helix-turn-helix domain-containing protein [Actinomycetota bacterium]